MNKARRKRIEKIAQELEDLRSDLELVTEEEQEAYDNMPESFQMSERGEHAESVIENLELIMESMQEALDGLYSYEDE